MAALGSDVAQEDGMSASKRVATSPHDEPGSTHGEHADTVARTSDFSRPDHWRHDNIGRLLNNVVRRFEARVLELMSRAGHIGTRIAHVSLTRSLDLSGTRITELARRSAMTKQAMGELVQQCEALGLVETATDTRDRRARLVRFTGRGLAWLDAFRAAVDEAEREMREEAGDAAMESVRRALASYGRGFDALSSE